MFGGTQYGAGQNPGFPAQNALYQQQQQQQQQQLGMMGGFAAQQGNMQQQGMMNQQPGYGQQQQMGGFSGMGASNYGQQPQQLQMQSGNIQGQYGQQSFASPLPNVSMPQQQQQSQGYSSQGFPGLQPQQQLQSQLPGMIGIQRQLTSGSMSGAPLSPKSTRASISAEPPKNLASLVTLDFITASDLAGYEQNFQACGPNPNGQIGAMEARNMFVKSQLSQDDLARVWDLSSVRRAADLTFPEFAIAMFLIRLKMKGQDIPPALPDNVKKQVLSSIAAIDASKKPAGPPQNFGGPTVGIMAPTSTMPKSDSLSSLSGLAAPRMTDGFAGPLASRAQAVTSPKQLRKDGATWAVTPSEKAQYDSIFKVWDPTNSGFISGDRARQVFSQSGLADNVLAHVWGLADTQNSGKLNSNEFAVAMHLIYKKLNGQDLPKVLPPELVPPSTRELDAMASLMKNQLLSDIGTKKIQSPSAFSSTTSLVEDPLFAGFSAKPAPTTSLYSTRSQKEKEEEEKKALAEDLEKKKRELASATNYVEVNAKTVKEVEREIDRARRDAANVHDEVVWSMKSKNRIVSEALKSGKAVGPTSDPSADLSKLENDLNAVIRECRQLERARADKRIADLRAKDASGGGGGGDAASRTAALLAARMAALGVNAPMLGGGAAPATTSSSSSSTLAADIARVEDELRARERELDDAAARVRGLADKARTVIASAGPSRAGDASNILSRLRKWEPSTDDKLKYIDGFGLRSVDARTLVDEFKKTLPVDAVQSAPASTPVAPAFEASAAPYSVVTDYNTAVTASTFGSNPFATAAKAPAIETTSNNPYASSAPFGNFTSRPSEISSYSARSSISAPVPPPPQESGAAAAAAKVAAVTNVLAQAEAAMRAAQDRASQRAAVISGTSAFSPSAYTSATSPILKSPPMSHAVMNAAAPSVASPFGAFNTSAPKAEAPPASMFNASPASPVKPPIDAFASIPTPPAPKDFNPFGTFEKPAPAISTAPENEYEKMMRKFKEEEALLGLNLDASTDISSAQRFLSNPGPAMSQATSMRAAAPPSSHPAPSKPLGREGDGIVDVAGGARSAMETIRMREREAMEKASAQPVKRPPPPPVPRRDATALKAAPPVPPPARKAAPAPQPPPPKPVSELSDHAGNLAEAAKRAREAAAKLSFGGTPAVPAIPASKSTPAVPSLSSQRAAELPESSTSVKDFAKTFNPFAVARKPPTENEETTSAPVDDVPLPAGGPPPPPPPPPPLLPSVAASMNATPRVSSSVPIPPAPVAPFAPVSPVVFEPIPEPVVEAPTPPAPSGSAPPPPPPPPPILFSVSSAPATPRPSDVTKVVLRPPSPSPPKPQSVDDHLKQALLQRRKFHSDSDSEDDDDWGSTDVLKKKASRDLLGAASVPPPAPFAAPFSAVESEAPAAPPAGGPPPPPPPPPPGIAPPVQKFERGASATEVTNDTPKKKPSPADVGAQGPNLFSLAAISAGAAGLKPTGARKSAVEQKPLEPPVIAKTPSARKQPPPPPPSHKRAAAPSPAPTPLAVPAPDTRKSEDGWEVVDRDDAFKTTSNSTPTGVISLASSAASANSTSLLDEPAPASVSEWNPFKPGGIADKAANRKSVVETDFFGDAFAGVVPLAGDGEGKKELNRMSVASDIFSDARAFGVTSPSLENPFPTTPKMDYTPFTQPSPVTAEVFAPAVPEPVAPPPEPETPVVLYHVKALFQFTAGREDDMSLEADDVIEVEKEDGDWMYGAKGGERGWFPQNFVEKFDPNVIAEPELEPEPAVVEAETVLFRAEAMYDYDAQRDDEVTIKTGDFVDVYRKDGDWWEVVNGESRGVVPRIYLKEVEDAPPLVPIKARHEYLAVGGVPQMRVGSEYSIASQPVVDADFGNIGMAREGSGAHSARGSVAGQHWVSVVAQNDFERLTLDERKRQESIFELIQTEQSYVRDLQIIFEVFYQPITQLLSKQDVDTIFSNLEDILMTNTIILSDWEEAQKQSDYVIMNIGTLFERNALALDCYKIYCSNLMVASKLLQKRRQESEKLQDFLKNCQRNAQCRSLDLSSFLLQPMQRVTRYTLIFKQILNYTPQGHPEHAAVVRAAQVADRMATLVNMAAREQESKEKIEALIAQIDFDASSEFGRIDLLGPTRFGSARLYVFDSALSKAKSGRKLHGYIFTDMILLLQQQKNLGVFNDAKPMYTLYHAPIPVDQCTVRDAPRSSGVDECTFQIVAPGDIITVKAPSASVKAKWLSNHDTALANFLAYSR